MRLTTKGRYAVTAMLDLALNQGKGAVTLQDIALKQEISLSYLEHYLPNYVVTVWSEAPGVPAGGTGLHGVLRPSQLLQSSVRLMRKRI